MRHSSHGCRIRRTTLACLIAEQASLDALYHGYTEHATCRLVETKSILQDGKHDLWQEGDIPKHHTNGNKKINDCHHGNHRGRELRHAMNATEDDEKCQRRKDDSHGGRLEAESLLPSRTDGIALHGIIGEAKGNNHQHGEEDAHPSLAQTIFHIVGRTAIEGGLASALVKLCQG